MVYRHRCGEVSHYLYPQYYTAITLSLTISPLRLALNGSFTIFYIIGNVDGTSTTEWSRLPGLVGVTHVFAAPVEACDHCGKQEEQSQLVTSTSPITSLLLDYVETGRLESMEAQDVEPFLIANLKWRVQTVSVLPPIHSRLSHFVSFMSTQICRMVLTCRLGDARRRAN